jgi:hypothetical protein
LFFCSVFEFHHRFAGWFAVACVWVFVGLSVSQQKVDGHWVWSGHDLVHAQQFWFTLFATLLYVSFKRSIPTSSLKLFFDQHRHPVDDCPQGSGRDHHSKSSLQKKNCKLILNLGLQPSERTAIVKFQRGIQQGLLGRISRAPVGEYHGFGIISEGIESKCHCEEPIFLKNAWA